ncbi:uncharacterized protein [Watersipora subatra]|uniref:uncharacterized protein n=1 Tax=Watersipora subatra TaxID=2589382 RepID=UPI00355BB89F
MVDYFTNFFECEQLKETTTKSLIKASKKTFARYGISDVAQFNHGPQFTASEFIALSEMWGFQHTTSSPGHQQFNGKAESTVQILRKMMKRAEDPFIALLEYRNTPTAGMSSSPAKRMSRRPTRSMLNTGLSDCNPTQDNILGEKTAKKLTTQRSYNKSGKDFVPLSIGSLVLSRTFKTQKVN